MDTAKKLEAYKGVAGRTTPHFLVRTSTLPPSPIQDHRLGLHSQALCCFLFNCLPDSGTSTVARERRWANIHAGSSHTTVEGNVWRHSLELSLTDNRCFLEGPRRPQATTSDCPIDHRRVLLPLVLPLLFFPQPSLSLVSPIRSHSALSCASPLHLPPAAGLSTASREVSSAEAYWLHEADLRRNAFSDLSALR